MEALLRNFIRKECRKHINRYNEYLFSLNEDFKRRSQRLGSTPPKIVKKPIYWKLHPHFNPFKVITERQLNKYAYTITQKVVNNEYQPKSSLVNMIPKHDGSYRETNIFSLPDSALSRMVYKSLLHKNINRFSAYCYAYREDRNAHDSILEISTEWKRLGRIFVAEYDFSKFFDNIHHEHIWNIFRDHNILATDAEKNIISQFLTSKNHPVKNYFPTEGTIRTKGIPQGTSISLFLANIACWELDRELARLGVSFSRYADDTVIWDKDYAKVVRAYELIAEFGKLMGVPINYQKSEGINLISEHGGEIRSKPSIEYLGYNISLNNVSIGDKSIDKIKRRIGYIIYRNLLQPLRQGIFNQNRLGPLDWDYVAAITQIRSYLYGGLSERQLRNYINGAAGIINFRGVMSYYPVVNDDNQLRKLDGWLLYSLKQSLKLRQKLWGQFNGSTLPGPSSNWINNIETLKSHVVSNINYNLRIPSFSFINKAMNKGMQQSGLKSVTDSSQSYY